MLKLVDGFYKKNYKVFIEEIKGFESDNVLKYVLDELFKWLVGLGYFWL